MLVGSFQEKKNSWVFVLIVEEEWKMELEEKNRVRDKGEDKKQWDLVENSSSWYYNVLRSQAL